MADHRASSDEMFARVYTELRRLAGRHMARERPGNTLQTTALVHEAYLRLSREGESGWEKPGHFFAAAAEAMRRILVDRARQAASLKRGGDRQQTTWTESENDDPPEFEKILAVDEAVRRLEEIDSQMSEVVKLRYFAGLTIQETAEALELSSRSVNRLWAAARAWLYREFTRLRESEE